MTYDDLTVLIPSHSLEDFPTELGEQQAASLLNAFAVVWHPSLIASAGVMPSWHRSDEPPEGLENKLILVPSACDDWIPGGWVEKARSEGATVVSGISERNEMIRAAIEPLELECDLDADLVADFLALGSCFLQLELLTRHMHHFSNLDDVHLQSEAVSAAQAAVSGDETAARSHLRNCFEALQEARERFYPVDCYLIDLCLLIPRQANEHLERSLKSEAPFNLLVSATHLQTINEQNPSYIEMMRDAWQSGRLDIAGGELYERPSPLLPLGSVLWDFREGLRIFRKLLGRTPKTWGRRRFGFSTVLPQILNKYGYTAG